MEEQLFAIPQTQRPSHRWRFSLPTTNLLSPFFATDRTPDNHLLIDLQRRACWITLCIFIQSMDMFNLMAEQYLKNWSYVIAFPMILASFYCLWRAFRRTSLREQTRNLSR